MNIIDAFILGAVQGFAEFLPISSSGHLILLKRWLGISSIPMFFDVMLHIATLIPIAVVMFKEIIGLFKRPFKKILFLVIASIPAALTGFLLGDLVEGYFYGSNALAVGLLSGTFCLTAIELVVSEYYAKKKKKSLPLNYVNTAVMGVAQSIAIVPGLSRSGTVLSAGSFMGVKKEENANFTFLLSIPVILGAALVSGIKAIKGGVDLGELAVPLAVGMVSAVATGFMAITVMLKLIKSANYKWFAIYLVLIAAVNVATFVFLGK